MRCVCGCGARGANRHHVVYQQELRRAWSDVTRRRDSTLYAHPPSPWRSLQALVRDDRNLVWMAFECHERHHKRSRVLPLHVLPESVYSFAVELLGNGAAYEYLRRHYARGDPRLDALLYVQSA